MPYRRLGVETASSTSSTTSTTQCSLASLFATGTTDVQSLLASILGANS
ncbi:MAG: hypothetical protein ABSG25_10185 [Bryobacteraceae bacterium]